jgi:hypothetical protein
MKYLHYAKARKAYSNSKSEYRNSKQIQMNKIRMTKTKEPRPRPGFVLSFENWSFGIVSEFGIRYSDFPCSDHCNLQKSRTKLIRQRTSGATH